MDSVTSVWPQTRSLSTPHGIFVARAPRNARGPRGLRFLCPAPFRDEQRHRLGRLLQRLQVDIFVEPVHLAAARAEAEAWNAVIESVETRVGERGEDEIFDRAAINLVEAF